MSDKTEEAIQKSTDYYNSSDTDNYYRKIWGGESIHAVSYTHLRAHETLR